MGALGLIVGLMAAMLAMLRKPLVARLRSARLSAAAVGRYAGAYDLTGLPSVCC
jgi:hypothetical protein